MHEKVHKRKKYDYNRMGPKADKKPDNIYDDYKVLLRACFKAGQ